MIAFISAYFQITMKLVAFLVALAAVANAVEQLPQVDLDYAVYEGTSNATLGLNIYKGLVVPQ